MSHLTASVLPYFYPRPPRGGRPRRKIMSVWPPRSFLPTPSARRATETSPYSLVNQLVISTHALREEGDHFGLIVAGVAIKFLPTPSARRATAVR